MPALFNTEMETLDRASLRTIQLAKLQQLVERVYEQSPYYREKLNAAGVAPRHLKTLSDYQHFPFFDKDEERLSQERSKAELGHPFGMHITCDPKLVNRISSSSGTTGSPTFSGFTPHRSCYRRGELFSRDGTHGCIPWRRGAARECHQYVDSWHACHRLNDGVRRLASCRWVH